GPADSSSSPRAVAPALAAAGRERAGLAFRRSSEATGPACRGPAAGPPARRPKTPVAPAGPPAAVGRRPDSAGPLPRARRRPTSWVPRLGCLYAWRTPFRWGRRRDTRAAGRRPCQPTAAKRYSPQRYAFRGATGGQGLYRP